MNKIRKNNHDNYFIEQYKLSKKEENNKKWKERMFWFLVCFCLIFWLFLILKFQENKLIFFYLTSTLLFLNFAGIFEKSLGKLFKNKYFYFFNFIIIALIIVFYSHNLEVIGSLIGIESGILFIMGTLIDTK